jgi:hypothetical protein
MTPPRYPDRVPTAAELQVLQMLYEEFCHAGAWPTFQYAGARAWQDHGLELRGIYFNLSDAGFLRPPIAAWQAAQLRDETNIGITVGGLTYVPGAHDDIARFVAVVRYLAERAARFRPATAVTTEQLVVTSEEARLELAFAPTGSALQRLVALVRDDAYALWTSLSAPGESGEWTITINQERARRFREIHTLIDFFEVEAAIHAEYVPQFVQPFDLDEPTDGDTVASTPLLVQAPAASTRDPDRDGAPAVAGVDSPPPDVFISHAGEDKIDVARPLAEALTARGWVVWLDELEMTVGDSLTGRLNAALARSRFGVVILSPAFFSKHWPQRELEALATREAASGTKVILPVWHGIDLRYLADVAPMLGDRLGVSTEAGIEHVAAELTRALERARDHPGAAGRPSLLVSSLGDSLDVDTKAPASVVAALRKRLRDFAYELDDLLDGDSPEPDQAVLQRYRSEIPRDGATYRRLGLDLLGDAKEAGLATDRDLEIAWEADSVAQASELFREVAAR